MKRNLWIKKLPLAVLACGVVIATAAFQSQPAKAKQKTTDTVPDRNKKVRDIDEALEALENSKAEVDQSLKNIDFAQIEKQIKEATENIHIDAAKMKAEMQALKEVDMTKMKANLEQSLKEIDAAKIQAQVNKAMKEVDMEKIQADMQASIAKIDFEKLNKELEKVRSVDFEKLESNMKKLKPEIEKSMKEAHKSIDKAKEELKIYKSLIDGLDKDGLINKKENYAIEYKNGELNINGKKQPAEVVNKYQQLLKGHKDFTIKKDADDFNIDND